MKLFTLEKLVDSFLLFTGHLTHGVILLHFRQFLARNAWEMTNKMHQLPTIEIWLGTPFPPCGHSGKSNAIMDDKEQFAVGEGLRLYLTQIRCSWIEVLSNQGRAPSVIPVAVRAVVRKVNPRFCKNLI